MIDKGDNNAPGGVSHVDLDGAQRIGDGAVDLGAYERAGVFADGFETGGS